MKVGVFSTKSHDRAFLAGANKDHAHEFVFFAARLTPETVSLAKGFRAICIFVNDLLNASMLDTIAQHGIRLVALRCAGFNNVDLAAAKRLGVTVVRVPAYSPHSVAEHTVGLLLTLNRKIHRGFARVREGNFALDGLLGFDIHGQTVGIIGTGKIGTEVAKILSGFGCKLLAYDVAPNPICEKAGVSYTRLSDLFGASDIITLHCPLTPETHHIIDSKSLKQMKSGVVLINTSRGALIDTRAVIQGLKSGQIGYLGLDVYEEEADLFFEDLSDQVIHDDVFARLLTFPNVVITGHQAFFTENALQKIAETTVSNITEFERQGSCGNEVSIESITG